MPMPRTVRAPTVPSTAGGTTQEPVPRKRPSAGTVEEPRRGAEATGLDDEERNGEPGSRGSHGFDQWRMAMKVLEGWRHGGTSAIAVAYETASFARTWRWVGGIGAPSATHVLGVGRGRRGSSTGESGPWLVDHQRRRALHLRDPHWITPCGAGARTASGSSGSATPRSEPRRARSAIAPTGSDSPPASTTPAPPGPTTACGAGDRAALDSSDWRQKGGRTAPSRVGADTNWASVIAGYAHTCGIRTDHTLWCWGGDSSPGSWGWVTTPTAAGPPRSAPAPTGPSSKPVTPTPVPPASTTPCGAGDTTPAVSSGSATSATGAGRPRSASAPTGRTSVPGMATTPVPFARTTPCGAGDSTARVSSASATPDSDNAHPGRHLEQLAPPQRRPQANLRNPSQPHPVVLGAQQLRPGRGRRHD